MELLSSARQAVEAWSLLSGHPGLVTPREAFISSDMDGTPSLVVVYPYYPGDVTLAQAHLQPTKVCVGWGGGVKGRAAMCCHVCCHVLGLAAMCCGCSAYSRVWGAVPLCSAGHAKHTRHGPSCWAANTL
jgi:hypothetical protein